MGNNHCGVTGIDYTGYADDTAPDPNYHLDLTVAPLPSGGSELRVDSAAVWAPPRPHSTLIPKDDLMVTVSRSSIVPGKAKNTFIRVAQTVSPTGPAAVGLVADLDALAAAIPLDPPTGSRGCACPAESNAVTTVTVVSHGVTWVYAEDGYATPSLTRGGVPVAGLRTTFALEHDLDALLKGTPDLPDPFPTP